VFRPVQPLSHRCRVVHEYLGRRLATRNQEEQFPPRACAIQHIDSKSLHLISTVPGLSKHQRANVCPSGLLADRQLPLPAISNVKLCRLVDCLLRFKQLKVTHRVASFLVLDHHKVSDGLTTAEQSIAEDTNVGHETRSTHLRSRRGTPGLWLAYPGYQAAVNLPG